MGPRPLRRYTEVILVEGLFDYAVLWQAGFRNVSCAMGTQLNAYHFRQYLVGLRSKTSLVVQGKFQTGYALVAGKVSSM